MIRDFSFVRPIRERHWRGWTPFIGSIHLRLEEGSSLGWYV